MTDTKISTWGQDEVVIRSINDHWIVLIRPFFTLLFVMFLSGLGFFLARVLQDFSTYLSFGVLFFGILVLMVAIHWFFLRLIQWELSSCTITTHRVLDFQCFPFLENDFSFVIISQIHEIQANQHGFLHNLLNFGDIHIMAAATPDPMIIKNLPNPGKITNLVEAICDNRLESEIDPKDVKGIYHRRFHSLVDKG